MTPGTLIRRLRGTLRTHGFEAQMEDELRMHLELEADECMRRGMTPTEARAAAGRRFGSVAQVKDECRDSWGVRTLDAAWQDVRLASRALRSHPGHTAAVLLTLALGVGANTAVFSVVHAVLLRSLPYANGDRLVEIRQTQPGAGLGQIGVSAKEVDDYRRQSGSLDAVVEYHQMSFTLLGHGDAARVRTGVVSHDFFDVVGVTPVLGRTFRAADDRPGAPAVLVLSYEYWQHELGGDPHVVGRAFEMNDRVHTVVGVLPRIPQYPEDNDVYMPVSACPFRSSAAIAGDREARMVSAIGRVGAEMSLERVRRDVAAVARRMQAAVPAAYPPDAGFSATALPVKDELTQRARPTLLTLLGITGFVLLLVCANVAQLTLARLAGRTRELAMRAALGAGRARIARQLFTESTLLAAAGGALGVLFAWLTRGLLVAYTARFTPRAPEIRLDGTVLLFAAGVSLTAAIVSGVAPALVRSDRSAPLRDAQRAGGHGGRGRGALIAAQVAISFVLLMAAGLMVRTAINLQRVNTGFSADHVLTAKLTLDFVKYDTAAKRRAFYLPLLDAIREQPDVRSAALGVAFPLDDSMPEWFATPFRVEGRPPPDGQPQPRADFKLASAAYFQTIGMTLRRGRWFTAADADERTPGAIVSASFARRHFAGVDPIGQRVSTDRGAHWIAIVGIVNDVKQYGLTRAPGEEVYVPFALGGPLNATLLVRTAGAPLAALAGIQAAVRRIDPRQPLSEIQTLDDARASALASPRSTAVLMALFAIVALLITAAGIAGVASFSVSRRTTEIGVRMALGAPAGAVARMIVRQGLAPVCLGLAIGVGVSLLLTRLAATLLYGVAPTDPPTFALVAGVLAVVATLSCAVPARRAAAIDPMRTLKAE